MQRMQITGEDRQRAIRFFNLGKQAGFDLKAALAGFAQHAGESADGHAQDAARRGTFRIARPVGFTRGARVQQVLPRAGGRLYDVMEATGVDHLLIVTDQRRGDVRLRDVLGASPSELVRVVKPDLDRGDRFRERLKRRV